MAKLFEIARIDTNSPATKAVAKAAKSERRRKARISMNKLIMKRYNIAKAMDVCVDEDYLALKERFDKLSQDINALREEAR